MNRQLPLCCFALCILGLGCSRSDEHMAEQAQNDRVTDQTPPASPTDTQVETTIDGMPGPKGQPPSEIRTLVPPIKLIAAGEHWDGGTTWVVLEDERGAKVVFCVTQDGFESEIKANSLFIGADNANETSARRPLSDQESTLILDSLKSAVESRLNEKLKEFTKKGYDPLEYQNYERFTIPEEERFSQNQWHVLFAAHALRRLETVEKQELANRDELAKRVAELESVDLESASAKFRSMNGTNRYAEWERVRPVLVAELKAK